MPSRMSKGTPKKIITEDEVKFCETYLSNQRDLMKTCETLNITKMEGNRILRSRVGRNYLRHRVLMATKHLGITFDWKLEKLKNVIDHANLDEIPANVMIQAISELNKMQGHYSAEKHVNVNANVTLDPNLKKVTDLLEDLRKKYERDY